MNRLMQEQLLRMLSGAEPDAAALNNALRLLAKWRSSLMQNTWVKQQGTVVRNGVFEGMQFLPQSAEGCHVPKLLGCYEQPLQAHVEAAIGRGYATVINIGCAEGYYAVGMARRLPQARVFAHDSNPAAQQACRKLAEMNGVQERIAVGALFSPQDFAVHAGEETLVLCDIEGAEKELLDPAAAPALAGMDIIVESHECLRPGITRELVTRFSSSHDIVAVQDDGMRHVRDMPEWFAGLAHLDQLLALWEWRSGPTPWLVMRAKR